jgi:hypothetical protein
MAFSNLSFETGDDGSGCATGWTFACTGQFEYAEFDSRSAETFESWITIKISLDGSTIAALFDVGEEAFEDFDEGWGNNDYVFGLAGIAGVFDTTTPQLFEDFDQEWSSNESFKYSFTGVGVDLTAASFDTSPEAFEDFEEDWVSGYKFSFTGVGTDLTAASFDTSPEAYEDFEEDWPTLIMTTM